MTGRSPVRLLLASALFAAGFVAALLLGVAPDAALVPLLAGAVAVAALGPRAPAPAPATVEPERAPARPGVRDFIEALAEPVLIVRNRRVALANAAARAALGSSIEGEDVRLAIRHPLIAERLIDPALPGDDSAPAELVGVGEAERRWTVTVARLPDGARLVRLEDRSAAHAAERMRTDFVANASHELRTPLATILGFVETLEDLADAPPAADGPDMRARFLSVMHGEARRMQRLVDDLISLSRIQGERFSVPREAHDLLPLLEQARNEQRRLSEDRGSPILIEAAEDLPAIAGDRPQLLQLLDNLLGNALNHGRAGTPVTVTAALDRTGMLRIAVADRGDGIARGHLPRLTERFYRVDPGRSRAGGGTGLGLSIVKHIVERHRGRLGFNSELGRGTTVTVWLPASPPASSKSHGIVAGPGGQGARQGATG